MKTILDNTNFVVSRRQPKNLKKLLTRAEFSSETSNQKRVSKCNESKCGTCDVLITGNSVKFKNGKRWDIKSAMSCKSRYLIYVIICPNCRSFYVGQTEHLRNRVTVHKEQIKHEKYRQINVSEHLARCSNGSFNIMPIYKCENTTRIFRENKEQEIIKLLKLELNSSHHEQQASKKVVIQ